MKPGKFNPGTRVTVIATNAPDGTIYSLGSGTYEGDLVPPAELKITDPTPCVKLDTGEIAWGYDFDFCGSETSVKEFLKDSPVKPVTLAEAKALRAQTAALSGDEIANSAARIGAEMGFKIGEALVLNGDQMMKSYGADAATSFMVNALNTAATMAVMRIVDSKGSGELYEKISVDIAERMLEVVRKYMSGAEIVEAPVPPSSILKP